TVDSSPQNNCRPLSPFGWAALELFFPRLRSCSFPVLLSEAIDIPIIASHHDTPLGHSRRAADRLANFVGPKFFAVGQPDHIKPAIIGADHDLVAADRG